MLNSISITGRITTDPNKKMVASPKGEQPCTEFGLANDADYGDYTNFFWCEAWRKTADFISQYGRKGMLVTINGKLRQKNGFVNGEKRSFIAIQVDNIYLPPKRDSQETPHYDNEDSQVVYEDDDLPWD